MAIVNEKKLREKIAQEIEEELCGCDCGDLHCFDNAIIEAAVIARGIKWQ